VRAVVVVQAFRLLRLLHGAAAAVVDAEQSQG
jgi:hypothetical protein